ncbi:MAG TPA: hypothetical protein VK694_05675 [Verrucomicrobiae bacterium]|nr:hypothetical protein [Verrucomicrobiae bacterium]
MSALEQGNASDPTDLVGGEYVVGFLEDKVQALDEAPDTSTEGVTPPPYADIRWPEDRPAQPPVRLSQEVVVVINGQPVIREELYARTYYGSSSVPPRQGLSS